ncbi:flagellar assembly protein FliW [Paenibacillus sp. FSL R5-0623]|uniref:flagellar assembly protein FliW n=1 Tax=Paenibacillus sp. FSL R5-0623 TaxID=2921651 RepID=UPI0030DACFC8
MAFFNQFLPREAFVIHIQTSIWGEIEVKEEDIFKFPKGLPGFEDKTEFTLIPWEDTPFTYLQSIQEPGLSFLLVSPFVFMPSYSFELADIDKEELAIEDQVTVYTIVTIHSQANNSTMNLLAPIVLNPENRLGKQVILHQSGYEPRHLIWAEEEKTSVKGGV